MTDETCFFAACELARHYRAGTLSPVEVARAVLRHVGYVNPRINAIYHLDADGAIAAARAAEARWRRGTPKGALDGVPILLQDCIRVAGMPTFRGTSALAGEPVERHDSPVTARLREDGAVIVGKTTMPDFGLIDSGLSSQHGITRNPWNLARNVGGSGAAAAVAAGIGPLAVGCDLSGAVRIAASFCGVLGLKPSYGRVPIADPSPMLVAGPIARNVDDAAMLLQVLSRPDPTDYTSLPWDDCDYLGYVDTDMRGLRIGLLTDAGFGHGVAPDVRACIEGAAATMTDLGARVEPMPPLLDGDVVADFDRIVQASGWIDYAMLAPARQAFVLPEVATWCRGGAQTSAAEVARATYALGRARQRVIAACAPYDFVIGPTIAVEAFAADSPWAEGSSRHNAFSFPFNLSEQPALSIGCGFTPGGLPVGLQIVGKRFDDAGVLRVARTYEAARPPIAEVPLHAALETRSAVLQ